MNFNQGEKIKKESICWMEAQLLTYFRILGVEKLTEYFVSEVQSLQTKGVVINDKHIETIVRQMLKRVEVKDPGRLGSSYWRC